MLKERLKMSWKVEFSTIPELNVGSKRGAFVSSNGVVAVRVACHAVQTVNIDNSKASCM